MNSQVALSFNLFFLITIVSAWIFSPLIAWWLSKPFDDDYFSPEKIEHLQPSDKVFLRILARKTWRYFEEYVRKEDNYLPLDNF